eukprot:4134066-Pleurochrysis_carterae.AAC.2
MPLSSSKGACASPFSAIYCKPEVATSSKSVRSPELSPSKISSAEMPLPLACTVCSKASRSESSDRGLTYSQEERETDE